MTTDVESRLERIETQLRALPVEPGVYLFRDAGDAVLYAGKAKSLRSRVRSYFRGGDARLGVPDLVDHGVHGLLARPGDPSATAEAIAALLADPGRRRAMGEAGRRRVRDRYSVDRLVSDVGQLYAELLLNRPPSLGA